MSKLKLRSRWRRCAIFGLLAVGILAWLGARGRAPKTRSQKPATQQASKDPSRQAWPSFTRLKPKADFDPAPHHWPASVAQNRPPVFGESSQSVIAEAQRASIHIPVEDPDGDPIRVYAIDLPHGARWDETAHAIHWTPDFTQGGWHHDITLLATDGKQATEQRFRIIVEDSIAPPEPEIESRTQVGEVLRLEILQRTDAFLDSPVHAGRSFRAVVSVPLVGPKRSLPVRVFLHSLSGKPSRSAWPGVVMVAPHDPQNTYWWGYDEALPEGPSTGKSVPPYTQRRVMHLLEWTLKHVEVADPDQVYLEGWSMGGAGALSLGTLWARHFAWVHAGIAQTIPRLHRTARIRQLESIWGPVPPSFDADSPWDAQDLTHILKTRAEARDSFLTTRHAKDDATIFFSAATTQSPVTQLSFYQSLETSRVGHLSVWDEGNHTRSDPVLGKDWWQSAWHPVFRGVSRLALNRPFVAFSLASHNEDFGDGGPNGKQPGSLSRGYHGKVQLPGDSGWSGQDAGSLNRLLRWVSSSVKDDFDRFSIEIYVKSKGQRDPPQPGYPPQGDHLNTAMPVHADVTLRRLQRFWLRPGERVAWRFAEGQGEGQGEGHAKLQGEIQADADGCVTVPQLPLTPTPARLELWRLEGPFVPKRPN